MEKQHRDFIFSEFWHTHDAGHCKQYGLEKYLLGDLDPPHDHHPYNTWWWRLPAEDQRQFCAYFGNVNCFTTLNWFDKPEPPQDEQQNLAFFDYPSDFDSAGDPSLALADALRQIDFLREIGVHEERHYLTEFSGSKGFANRLPYQLFGQEPLPALTGFGNHVVAGAIAERIAKAAGLKTADRAVYSKRRQWRIPGTIHGKTGLYRTPLLRQDLEEGMEKIRKWSSEPPVIEQIDREAMVPNPVLAQWYREELDRMRAAAEERAARTRTIRSRERARPSAATSGASADGAPLEAEAPPACVGQALEVGITDEGVSRGVNRNAVTLLLACFCKDAGVPIDEAVDWLTEHALTKLKPFSSSDDARIGESTRSCVSSVYAGDYVFSCGAMIDAGFACNRACPLASSTATERRPEQLTDTGNAERLVRLHGHHLRHAHGIRWATWDGMRWRHDQQGKLVELAKDCTRRMYAEAAEVEDEDARNRLVAHARRSESRSRIDAMISLAASDPRVAVHTDEFDADTLLLNALNGTVDLRDGSLRPHNPDDLITKLAPVHYDPDARCPRFIQFLECIMGGHYELIDFLQRAIGYSLTGKVSEHVLIILYGAGRNGKSTLVNVVQEVLGDYAATAAPGLLLDKKNEPHPTGLADLFGARFVVSSEINEGRALDEALVKQLTGGDKIKARKMKQDFFEFWPTHKLFIMTNHKPHIRGHDYAIWERVRLLPFNVRIARKERDLHLGEKLHQELPGILTWAVEGCLDWQEQGLGIPREVEDATDSYRRQMDSIGAFIQDCCATDQGAETPTSELYGAYLDYCGDRGHEPRSSQGFGHCLRRLGFSPARSAVSRGWGGLRLMTDDG